MTARSPTPDVLGNLSGPLNNTVASAAKLLARFCAREQPLVARGAGAALNDDDRTVVIAAQLLAIAGQLERIADNHAAESDSLLDWAAAHNEAADLRRELADATAALAAVTAKRDEAIAGSTEIALAWAEDRKRYEDLWEETHPQDS